MLLLTKLGSSREEFNLILFLSELLVGSFLLTIECSKICTGIVNSPTTFSRF